MLSINNLLGYNTFGGTIGPDVLIINSHHCFTLSLLGLILEHRQHQLPRPCVTTRLHSESKLSMIGMARQRCLAHQLGHAPHRAKIQGDKLSSTIF